MLKLLCGCAGGRCEVLAQGLCSEAEALEKALGSLTLTLKLSQLIKLYANAVILGTRRPMGGKTFNIDARGLKFCKTYVKAMRVVLLMI